MAFIQAIRILDSLMKFKPRGADELFMDHPTNSKRIGRLEHLIDRFPRTWLNNPFNEERYRKNILNRLNKRSRFFLPALV